MKNRILFVIPKLRHGGAEGVVWRVSGALAEEGYDVHVMEFYRYEGGYELMPGVRRYTLFPNEPEYQKTGFAERHKRIRRTLLDIRPDVIIPFLDYACQKVQLAAAGTRYFRRIVVTLRNLPTAGSKKQQLMLKASVLMARACVAQTAAQAAYLPKAAQKKTRVIANPVPIPQTPYAPCDVPFTFVAAGRMTEQKNYPMLLKAFAAVAANCDVYLRIYGAGELQKTLEAMIAGLGIENRVSLMGYSMELEQAYRECSAYVLSSKWEGMPNALMEALALGMPCVSADCPTGPAELITDGENGLLVPVDDAPALAEAMKRLAEDAFLRTRLGSAAREHMQREYHLSVITRQWVGVLCDTGLIDRLGEQTP